MGNDSKKEEKEKEKMIKMIKMIKWKDIEKLINSLSLFVIGFCCCVWWLEIKENPQPPRIVHIIDSDDPIPPTTVVKSSESFYFKLMRVTAYCPCEKCCGKFSDNVTSSGYIIGEGDRFVAAPEEYDFGTSVAIPGYSNDQPVLVRDRGGAIKGNTLDVFFDTHQEALEWGVKFLNVKIYDK